MTHAPTSNVRTRIAPSPTGFLHLGTARTALYSWAYARHYGGEFVLRIEDTDVARSTEDSGRSRSSPAWQWLGLQFDEGPIYQMQRLERYHAVVDQMIAAGTAYRCYASSRGTRRHARGPARARRENAATTAAGAPRPASVLPPVPEGVAPVVRFANPEHFGHGAAGTTWSRAPSASATTEIDDLIILRPDGVPTYNFAVVVDDFDMRISHVFRGDEHINNTPWQINIWRAIAG